MPVIDNITQLQHILDAAQGAVRYTKGKKHPELDKDDLLSLALIRLLEIIGEVV